MRLENKSLLLTSASSKIPLIVATQNALQRTSPGHKLLIGDTDEKSLAFHFSPHSWVMPLTDNYNFNLILEGCLKRNVELILPTRDGELAFFSQYKDEFDSYGIRVLVSSTLGVSRCLDKLLFYDYLQSLNYPVIFTSTKVENCTGLRFVVKDRYGSGSILVKTNLSREDALRAALSFRNPVIQPMINGREFSVDVWISQSGASGVSSVRFRDVILDGEARVTSTFRDDKIENLAISMARAIGISGLCVLQGFILADKSVLFIECNARVGGATTASINSGVPLLDLLIADALKLNVETILKHFIRRDLKQVRAPFDYCF
jgi:carbamoyl-phosphate synthase large subunit